MLALGDSERSVDMSIEGGHVATAARPPPTVADSAPPVTPPGAEKPNEIPFPLNSRRLTGPYLKAIARAIGLPSSGAPDETRVMIDGKLAEMGRDPRNVQVIVTRDTHGRETLALRDVDGEFVDVGALEEEGVRTSDDGGGEGEESDSTTSERSSPHAVDALDNLREQNEALSASNVELEAQVSSLKEEVSEVRDNLKKETERVGEMWKMNCAQVAGFDEAITAKDNEIECLKARISELEASLGRRPLGPALVPTTVSPVQSIEPTALPGSLHASTPVRRGKAPPMNEFSRDDPECLLKDWLPSL